MLDDSHCEATLMKLYSCWEMILLPKKMNVQRPVSCVHWWTVICRLWCQSRFEICDNSWGLHWSTLLWQQWIMQFHSTFCTRKFSLHSHICGELSWAQEILTRINVLALHASLQSCWHWNVFIRCPEGAIVSHSIKGLIKGMFTTAQNCLLLGTKQ